MCMFSTRRPTPVSTFQITGATAADFSPDSLKAYIVAGSTLVRLFQGRRTANHPARGACGRRVFSLRRRIRLRSRRGDFVARRCGEPATMGARIPSPFRRCQASSKRCLARLNFCRLILPTHIIMVAVDSPGLDIISVNTTPTGCSPAVTDGPVASFNLGQGNFVPTQLILSQDGTTAYVIASNLSSAASTPKPDHEMRRHPGIVGLYRTAEQRRAAATARASSPKPISRTVGIERRASSAPSSSHSSLPRRSPGRRSDPRQRSIRSPAPSGDRLARTPSSASST